MVWSRPRAKSTLLPGILVSLVRVGLAFLPRATPRTDRDKSPRQVTVQYRTLLNTLRLSDHFW